MLQSFLASPIGSVHPMSLLDCAIFASISAMSTFVLFSPLFF